MSAKLDLSGLDGFSSLLQAGADAAAAAGKPLNLDLDRVEEDPRNARRKYDPAKMQELADAIRANGLTTPIVVKVHPDDPKRYRIVHGHRRYRAHKLIEAKTIEAVVTDKQDSASQLVDNLQREDLTVAETVAGIAGLLADGLKQTQIAERLGKSKTWVSRYAALTELPDELQALLDSERCRDASTLYEALQCFKQDPDAVRNFLAATGDRQIVQTDIENLRAAMKRGAQPGTTTAEPETPATAPAATDGAAEGAGDGNDGSDTAETPVAQVSGGNPGGDADAEEGAGKALAQVFSGEGNQGNAGGSTTTTTDDDNDDLEGDDQGDQRQQKIKPTAAAPDPMKVRKPLVQIRVGRREGVMLIGKKADYGLVWVQFENGEEELIDVNKVKLVAVTDGAVK